MLHCNVLHMLEVFVFLTFIKKELHLADFWV